VLQYQHPGDDCGLETVPHLEALAALFAGSGLGQSMITAEHLLAALGLPVDADGDGAHKVRASLLQRPACWACLPRAAASVQMPEVSSISTVVVHNGGARPDCTVGMMPSLFPPIQIKTWNKRMAVTCMVDVRLGACSGPQLSSCTRHIVNTQHRPWQNQALTSWRFVSGGRRRWGSPRRGAG
jgi:hypothetical protein